MRYDIEVETATAHPIAAVRRNIPISEISSTWKPALDLVWEFLRLHPELRHAGHNLFLYRHPSRRDEAMEIDFGVEVPRSFQPEGEVVCVETPAGACASTTHRGPYEDLGAAHDAIHAWAAEHGRHFAGWSWELYGDWRENPADLETRVSYLLA